MSAGAAALALALSLLAAAPALAVSETVMSVPTRAGVTQWFVLVRPDGPPVASAILFTGGEGNLKLAQRGKLGAGSNFLVRNRQRFAERGFLVAVIDAPSDREMSGLVLFRSTAEHAQDVKAVIEVLRGISPAPVWLIGTSMGSVSAANAAARLAGAGAGAPDGLVLTSSVTRASRQQRESLNDVKLSAIRVPTLVVHHKYDECAVTPYVDARALPKALRGTPRAEFLAFEGGDPPQSPACEPFAPHGYFGLDATVVDAIVKWIDPRPR